LGPGQSDPDAHEGEIARGRGKRGQVKSLELKGIWEEDTPDPDEPSSAGLGERSRRLSGEKARGKRKKPFLWVN